jgi:hypothetical protein
MEKSIPVPESETAWGLAGALSVRLMVPVLAPPPVGVNVTPIVHVAPAATAAVVEQVVPEASEAKSPLMLIWLKFRDAFPEFVSVTVCAELVAPTSVLVNASVVGDRLTDGPVPVPVPVSATVCVRDVDALRAKFVVPGW